MEVFNFQTEDQCGYCAISAERHPGIAGPGSYSLNRGAGDLGLQVFSLSITFAINGSACTA